MKSENNYNKLNALIYELIIFLERFFPRLTRNPWIRKIKLNCRDDWATFRTLVTMMELEEEIENIHQIWKKEEEQRNRPIYSELPPDGSSAQQLLGGEMRLSAPWLSETSSKTEPSSSHERN